MTDPLVEPVPSARRDLFPKPQIVLLTALSGLLLVAGLMSAWFFKRIQDDYSALISQAIADLNAVQDITMHAGVGYANVVELPLTSDPAKRAELLQAVMAERAANDKIVESWQRTVTDPEIRSCLEEVLAKRTASRQESQLLITWGQNGVSQAIESLNWRPVLQSFVDYQRSCDKLGNLVQARSLRINAELTHSIKRLEASFFLLGVLPILVSVLLAILIILLIRATPAELDLH